MKRVTRANVDELEQGTVIFNDEIWLVIIERRLLQRGYDVRELEIIFCDEEYYGEDYFILDSDLIGRYIYEV